MSRPCVVGQCRCGGWGIVHDSEAEADTGLCHQELEPVELSPEDEAFLARVERLRDTVPDPCCSWCYGEAAIGNQEDAGRPLTEDEASGGFFVVHEECRPEMDALFAGLAARGVFVDVTDA